MGALCPTRVNVRCMSVDVACSVVHMSVCLSVCVLDTWVSCAEAAEPIEMPFGRLTFVGPRNHVLNGDADPYRRGTFAGDMLAHCNIYRWVHCARRG